jgi:hypothetical protein
MAGLNWNQIESKGILGWNQRRDGALVEQNSGSEIAGLNLAQGANRLAP